MSDQEYEEQVSNPIMARSQNQGDVFSNSPYDSPGNGDVRPIMITAQKELIASQNPIVAREMQKFTAIKSVPKIVAHPEFRGISLVVSWWD